MIHIRDEGFHGILGGSAWFYRVYSWYLWCLGMEGEMSI
jgi:hypothetical protein